MTIKEQRLGPHQLKPGVTQENKRKTTYNIMLETQQNKRNYRK